MKVRTIAVGGITVLALAGIGMSPASAGSGSKPLDGTKGSAMDMSNPPGQGNSDGNKGWRCDGNKGIGQGNPAFAACGGSETKESY